QTRTSLPGRHGQTTSGPRRDGYSSARESRPARRRRSSRRGTPARWWSETAPGGSHLRPARSWRRRSPCRSRCGTTAPTIGRVTVVTPFREWHLPDMLIEAEDDQLDRVRVGTPVSIDARSVKRDDDATCESADTR